MIKDDGINYKSQDAKRFLGTVNTHIAPLKQARFDGMRDDENFLAIDAILGLYLDNAANDHDRSQRMDKIEGIIGALVVDCEAWSQARSYGSTVGVLDSQLYSDVADTYNKVRGERDEFVVRLRGGGRQGPPDFFDILQDPLDEKTVHETLQMIIQNADGLEEVEESLQQYVDSLDLSDCDDPMIKRGNEEYPGDSMLYQQMAVIFRLVSTNYARIPKLQQVGRVEYHKRYRVTQTLLRMSKIVTTKHEGTDDEKNAVIQDFAEYAAACLLQSPQLVQRPRHNHPNTLAE